MVLVTDVNQDFGVRPVERDGPYAAMDTFDGDRKRGHLVIE